MAIFTCCGLEEFPITIRCIRQTKIIDHFISISLDVICYIFYTLCKKIYEGETEKRLADRFRAHLRDVEKKMRQNQLRAISITLITPITTWQFADYLCSSETQTAAKISKKYSYFS